MRRFHRFLLHLTTVVIIQGLEFEVVVEILSEKTHGFLEDVNTAFVAS
jgi:hypothetical protein